MLPGLDAIKKLTFYWVPVIVWMAAIFLLSNSTRSTLRSTREDSLSMLPPFVFSPFFVHSIEFAVLAILVYRLLASYQALAVRYVLAVSLVFAVAYGILDEFHQSFVAGRSSTLEDVGVDTLGVLIGLSVVELGVRLSRLLGR